MITIISLQCSVVMIRYFLSSKTLFKQEGFENASFAYWCGRKKTLKTELFETVAAKIITWFPCQSLTQIQIQNGLLLVHFQISPAQCGRKTFDASQSENVLFKFIDKLCYVEVSLAARNLKYNWFAHVCVRLRVNARNCVYNPPTACRSHNN